MKKMKILIILIIINLMFIPISFTEVVATENNQAYGKCNVKKGKIVCADKEKEEKLRAKCRIEKGQIICPEDEKKLEPELGKIIEKPPEMPVQFGNIEEKDYIYSQSNFQEDLKTSSTAVDVVTRKDMETLKNPSVNEVMNTLSGVDVHSKGSIGHEGSIRIRGKQKVGVTLDGIRISDPLNNSIDLRHFLSEDVERIEVIKGAQSTIGGNNAQGGLVSIFTRRGFGAPRLEFNSGMGSFSTFKESASFSGGNEVADYYLGITRLDTNGGMATTPDGKSKRDAYKNLSLASNVGARLLEGKAELRNTFRYIEANKQVGIDAVDPIVFDPDDEANNVIVLNVTEFNHTPTSWYDYNVRFGVNKDRYKFEAGPLPLPDSSYYRYDNNRLQFSTQHNLRYKKFNTLSIGYNLEYNDYDNTSGIKRNSDQHDVYFNDVINIKDILVIRPGIRIMHSEDWGTFGTPNISGALILPTPFIPDSYSKIRSSYGHSISAPTLVQLNAPSYGNPDLKPEKLDGWDIGFEQSLLNDKIKFDFGYFRNDYNDLIDWVWEGPGWMDGKYQNISVARTYGYESSLTINPLPGLKASVNYTYTDSDDGNKEDLIGVPRNRYNFIVKYSPKERFSVYAKGTASSSRRYNSSGKRTDGYFDSAIGATVRLFKLAGAHVYAWGQINNLTNDKYEVSKDYRKPGIGFMAGISISRPF